METRELKITLDTATRWYNGHDNELKELAVQTFPELEKPKRAMSFEELGKVSGYYVDRDSTINEEDNCLTHEANKNIFPKKEQAEAVLALAQLLQLRQNWVGDWTPDGDNNCYSIEFSLTEGLIIDCRVQRNKIMSFPDYKTAKDFLNQFRDLLEIAKPLL